ncbi:MAG: hypothetical protein HUU48_06400 [Flavobacteriales bacterium]|nr:hypothetical protein [Flavobacteriales bacterium]
MSVRIIKYFFITLILSCNSYKYEEGIREYIKDTFNISTLEDIELMIILPINSCEPCVNETIHHLLQKNKDATKKIVIITGLISNRHSYQIRHLIKNGYKVVSDEKNNIIKYETNIGLPHLFKLKNGSIVSAVCLEDYNWDDF